MSKSNGDSKPRPNHNMAKLPELPPEFNCKELESLDDNKKRFLVAYISTGTIAAASRAAKVAYTIHYYWLEHDDTYAQAFKAVRETAADHLEKEAWFRATEGLRTYKFHQGNPIMVENPETLEMEHYFEVQRSDLLLIFLLKGIRPETYADKHMHAHAHKHDVEAEGNITTPRLMKMLTDLRADTLASDALADKEGSDGS